MEEFNGKISAEFTPPKTWVLNKELSFKTNQLTDSDIKILQKIGANVSDEGQINCDKGMSTDLASVPRVCWAFIAPWDVARAAVIHDHLYASLRHYYNHVPNMDKKVWKKGRSLSDKIFLLGMKAAEPKVSFWKKYAAYDSVRVFGRGPASKKTED